MAEGGLLASLFQRLATQDIDRRLAGGLGADLVQQLLTQLGENGYAPKTESWRDGGEMIELPAADMEAGIGSSLMFEMTSAFAIAPDELAELLARHLPAIVRYLRASGDLQQ